MKGIITENLQVEFLDHKQYGDDQEQRHVSTTKTLPIHPSDILWAKDNVGAEVEFYGQEVYVEPVGIHSNRGADVPHAKLILVKPTPVYPNPDDMILVSRRELIRLLLRITDESIPLFSSDRLQNLHKDVGLYVNKLKTVQPEVNRVEVIDHYNGKGRAFVHWQKDSEVEIQAQDSGKTLKIFISKKS